MSGARRPRLDQVANWCATCGEDFGSLTGFDRHRVGRPDHLFALDCQEKGCAVECHGRRCLPSVELEEKGWRRHGRGRWRTPPGATMPVWGLRERVDASDQS